MWTKVLTNLKEKYWKIATVSITVTKTLLQQKVVLNVDKHKKLVFPNHKY